ncbi:MAG TPA: ArgE/DapE family deacylase [Vicinamibacterales bacterium]|jgi:acetylornithine deacetylase|nr:ArgE/DapE family deacylase [Vicinamibacterales bacterium]
MDWTTQLLSDLVSVDSVNPSLVAGAAGEGAIASLLARELRDIGLDVHVDEVQPGRPNVVGVLEGSRPGRSLMFCGHVDTVGVEGMARPFEPVIRDGRLYGRGAQDMKGGVAAMIAAARELARGGLPGGRLIVACVIDEEYESLGAEAVVRSWRADGAVVTEPTDLQIAVGHKGFAWVDVETFGRAAHGSRPREGRDAIARMGRVLVALERLDRELQARPPHAIMGTGSLHASIIRGGRELSSYPDRCSLQVERRTIAGEPESAAIDEVRAIVDALKREDPEFEADARAVFSRPPYELPASHALPSALRHAAAAAGRDCVVAGMTFWTDAAVLGLSGTPSVLFGPGGAGLHSTEEYVNLEEVAFCRDALARLAREWCGGSPPDVTRPSS